MKALVNIETKSYEVLVPVCVDIVETLEGYQAWGYMKESPIDGKELLFAAEKEEMTYEEFQAYVEAEMPKCVSLFNDEMFDDEDEDDDEIEIDF